jgi:hypothetical protein
MEGTNLKPRTTAVERLVKPAAPRHEPEVENNIHEYQEARARSREVLMLDVRLRNGTIMSFDYAHLVKSRFEPEGKIVLRFGRDKVIAEGKNLLQLYGKITEHRQRFIKEGTEAEETLKPEDAAHIDKIEIQEEDEESTPHEGAQLSLVAR